MTFGFVAAIAGCQAEVIEQAGWMGQQRELTRAKEHVWNCPVSEIELRGRTRGAFVDERAELEIAEQPVDGTASGADTRLVQPYAMATASPRLA